MKKVAPTLSPLLRSAAQGEMLALLLLNPNDEYSLADIGRETGALPATVHREIDRLVASGLLSDRTVGRARLVRANTAHELFDAVTRIVVASYGPREILPQLLSTIDGVERAFIYGSWAARYDGESGPPPADIDVLILGSPSRASLAEVGRQAELVLHREVNFTRLTADEWNEAATPFIESLKTRPLVELTIDA